VIALLILHAASNGLPHPLPQPTLFCNNRGVLSHGNSHLMALLEKQKQADIICLVKFLSSSNNCRATWEWVEGHAVERKGWQGCTLPKRLNNQADKLAKCSLLSAIATGLVMEDDFPFEVVKFKLLGKRVSRSPRQVLDADWGYREPLELYDTKDIIWREDFHLVWWEGLGATMSSYPKMYQVWLTKHVSNFCGNDVQQYYWSNKTHSPKCESFGTHDKYTMQICRCKDPGHNGMLHITVRELYTWMVEILGNHAVASMVETYLLARGEAAMLSLVHGTSVDVSVVCKQSDHLRWDSLLEGRISSHWMVLISPLLQCQHKNLLPFLWGKQFITRLHNIVHKQWTYKNVYIHFKGKEGWTMPQFRT
jgi:hypothetical protein